MTRKLAIWLSWRNFSEYYSRKLDEICFGKRDLG